MPLEAPAPSPFGDRLRRWLPVAAWMTAVFIASTDAFSAGHTSRIIIPLLRWLSHGRLSMHQMEGIHFLIRKCAHLTEYGLLAILVWRAMNRAGRVRDSGMSAPEIWRTLGLALLICVPYAASDEFHQSFVPSRSSSVRDVAIDAVGAMIGLGIIALAHRRQGEAQAGPG
jgi:VanZ family protein